MKKLWLVLVLVAALLCLLAAPAFASAKTVFVTPTGGNDTHNIQAAFNAAVKAGPGSTVQLSAGHFYTSNIVVKNFKGCFRGAGEHKTFIDSLRGLNPSLPPVANNGLDPTLFFFSGGNISVCAMSFDITAASPAEPWQSFFNPGSTCIPAAATTPTTSRRPSTPPSQPAPAAPCSWPPAASTRTPSW